MQTQAKSTSILEPRSTQLAMPLRAVNRPDVEGLGTWLVEWADTIGLPPRYCGSRISGLRLDYLATQTFPRASTRALRLASASALMLCLLDDFVDLGEHGPVGLGRELEHLRGLLAGEAEQRDESDPLRRACAQFYRLSRAWPAAAMTRFHREVERLFAVWECEGSQTSSAHAIDPEAYIRRRRISCGMKLAYALFPVVSSNPPPQANVRLVTLESWACDLMAWTNDLWTAAKERGLTSENLVFVLERHHQISPRAAKTMVVAMHNDRIGKFVSLAAHLRAHQGDRVTLAYVEMLEFSVRAHHDWARLTGRYGSVDSQARSSNGDERRLSG